MTELARLKTPVFAAEGVLHIPVDSFRLEVKGLVNKSLEYSLDQLKAVYGETRINSRMTSVSGWSVRADWDGIPWKSFEAAIGLLPQATHILFHSARIYTTCVSLEDLRASTSMLVWGVGGEPLEDQYGGPLRMIVPNLWGYKSCKWIKTIEVLDHDVSGYWETRGYTDSGIIEPGKTVDINSKTTRPLKGGEVTEY